VARNSATSNLTVALGIAVKRCVSAYEVGKSIDIHELLGKQTIHEISSLNTERMMSPILSPFFLRRPVGVPAALHPLTCPVWALPDVDMLIQSHKRQFSPFGEPWRAHLILPTGQEPHRYSL